uniref:Uncharacterized protein n=1 Tax=Lepeophtheirus salmonis TaxID=72036 RepID=A0A0K2UYN9_LEPSM
MNHLWQGRSRFKAEE